MKVLNLFIVILILSASNYSYAGPNKGKFSQNRENSNVKTQELTAEEQEGLLYMREEEKLARDVYLTLDEYFEISIFSNIAKAEQKHMDKMKGLLDKYNLTDPVGDNPRGVFENPEFEGFYDSKTGNEVTIIEAIRTGILIEELDILDIQEAIELTDKADIKNVYEILLRGSRNHLRAFVRRLESMGIVYEATIIDQSVADDIVNSPTERSSSKGNGGKRKGRR